MSMRKLINAVEGSAPAKKSLTETKYKDATAILQEATANLGKETLKEGLADKMFEIISGPIKAKLIDAIRTVAQSDPEQFQAAVTNLIKAISNATDEQAAAGAEKIINHLNGQLAESAGEKFIMEMSEGKKLILEKEYVPYDARKYLGTGAFDWAVGDVYRDDFFLRDGKFNVITTARSLVGGLAGLTLDFADPRFWIDGFKQRPLITLGLAFLVWTIAQMIAWVGFDIDLGWLNNAASAYVDWRMNGTNPFGPDADWSDAHWPG